MIPVATPRSHLHHDYGRVFCMEAGRNVTHDHDIGSTWRHVAAVRQRGRLRLYLDGKLCATSQPLDPAQYDISNDRPMLIGFGARNYFQGAMDDLRVYRGALSAAEVAGLWRHLHRAQ